MAGEAGPTSGSRVRQERRAHEVEFGRIVSFSDGVFAIAITLLTLAIDLPEVPSGDGAALTKELLAESPDLLAYALSFAVVGRFWLVHHRFYATLQSFDGRLMAANLLYLALIVLVPFSSDVLGTYGNTSPAAMLYAANLGLAALVNWGMIRYSLTAGHVEAPARAATARFGSAWGLITPAVFFGSIPVALLSPTAAELMWLGALLGLQRQRRSAAR